MKKRGQFPIDPVMKRAKTKSKGVEKFQSSSTSSTKNSRLGGTKAGWMGLRSVPVTYCGVSVAITAVPGSSDVQNQDWTGAYM